MAARKYASIEQFDSLSAQIGTLLELVQNGNGQATVSVTPPVNATIVQMTNGDPYFTLGLAIGTLTHNVAITTNALTVGQGFKVPVRSRGFGKRLNRFLSGELTNPGGQRSYAFKWDETESQAVWSHGTYDISGKFTPTPAGHIFSLGRKQGKGANATRYLARVQ